MIAAELFQQSPRKMLTYLRLRLVDVNFVQSTAAVSLTIKQHPPFIHHFHGRDVILIKEIIAKEIN